MMNYIIIGLTIIIENNNKQNLNNERTKIFKRTNQKVSAR